jgi:hypothetical protein
MSSTSEFVGRSLAKMYRGSSLGSFEIEAGPKPKFFCRSSGGVCFSQSERRKVLSSEKLPSLKTSRNSHP